RFERVAVLCGEIFENNEGGPMPPGDGGQGIGQIFRQGRILLLAYSQVARAGGATHHQDAQGEETRKYFPRLIDQGSKFPWHAFHEILTNKEQRLNSSHTA